MQHPGLTRSFGWVNSGLCAAIIFSVLLGGCVSVPPVAPLPAVKEAARAISPEPVVIREFSLNGRVAVRYEEQGFSANLRWQHTPQTDDLLILSPLGQGIAQITRDGSGVSLLTSDRRELKAADAEELTQQALGWRLPLKGLSYWAVGSPDPGEFSNVQRDAQGRLTGFTQDGWDVAYRNYQSVDGATLPSRIELQRPNLEIKLIVDAWQTPKP